MASRTAQVNIGDRRSVLTQFRNRSQRPALIGDKGTLPKRTSNGTDDPARDIYRGVCYAFENFGLQVGYVVTSNKLNQVISVRFTRVLPGACCNFPGRIAGDDVGDTQNNELHQCLAGWRATGIYGGVVPTDDHRR